MAKYAMACKCGWEGRLAADASDKCPRCGTKLRLSEKESLGVMRSAIKSALAPKPVAPEIVVRTISHKQSPIDEGEWEFRLKEGILTIMAWNDQKTEAKVIRLARRGMDLLLEQQKEVDDDATP